MATTILKITSPERQSGERPKASLRGLLDALVSNRMRRAAAEAERVPARLSVREKAEGADDDRPEVPHIAAQHPLDHGRMTDANPAVAITRNEQGAWVARDAKGQYRGVFLLEQSAVSFVSRHSHGSAHHGGFAKH